MHLVLGFHPHSSRGASLEYDSPFYMARVPIRGVHFQTLVRNILLLHLGKTVAAHFKYEFEMISNRKASTATFSI